MNEEKALEIFKKNISAKSNKIERCGMGHGNYVYMISCETDKYVIIDAGKNQVQKVSILLKL